MEEAYKKVIGAYQANGKAMGIGRINKLPALANRAIQLGAPFITVWNE